MQTDCGLRTHLHTELQLCSAVFKGDLTLTPHRPRLLFVDFLDSTKYRFLAVCALLPCSFDCCIIRHAPVLYEDKAPCVTEEHEGLNAVKGRDKATTNYLLCMSLDMNMYFFYSFFVSHVNVGILAVHFVDALLYTGKYLNVAFYSVLPAWHALLLRSVLVPFVKM